LEEIFRRAVELGGLPFALVVVALFGGMAGKWVWGRELADCEQRTAAVQARCDQQVAVLRKDFEERIRVEQGRADELSRLLFEFLPRVDRAAGQTERLVETVREGRGRG
jgi:hypothetical protein